MAGYCPTVALDLLLRYDGCVNESTKGETALHRAAKQDMSDNITLLLEKGADVNAKSPEIDSPLAIAASHGFGKVARTLIDYTADLEVVGRNGKRLVDFQHGEGGRAFRAAV